MNNANSLFPVCLLLLTSIMVSLSSCGGDAPFQEEELLGRWDIETPYRNGKFAESLVDLFFDFQEGNRLVTNVTGDEQAFSYELDDELIYQREGSLDATYTIEELAEGRLVLITRLHIYDFRFELVRANAAEEAIQ